MLCQKISDGELISFVAHGPDGTLLGHAALVSYGDHSFEFGRDVVSPNARGYGLSKFLVQERLQYLHEHGTSLNIDSAVSETVTGHERSQHTYLKNDFVPTGVFAGIYTDFFARGVRETTILKTRILNEALKDQRTVYLPQEYMLLAAYTYHALDAHRDICSDLTSITEPSEPASYSLHTDDVDGFGMIKGKIHSEGTLEDLIQEVSCMMHQGVQYAAVGIPLHREDALLQIKRLQEAGFVYCGIQTEKDSDILYVQRIPDCWLTASESLCIVSPHAKLLVAFIKKEQELRGKNT